jgi:dihydropteroate synthase
MAKNFPKIMGILNITPDSFSDGGDYNNVQSSLNRAQKLLDNGAQILDIGGESSRPGAEPISAEDEISRVIPVIKSILEKFPETYISIDTTKYEVARGALELGAKMVNDISGLVFDDRLADLTAEFDADLCIMHMRGNPKIMQSNTNYDDIISEIKDFLIKQTESARSKGVKTIYVDPGIGFGKSFEQNITILKNLEEFENLGDGILLGISRKSFIGNYFNLKQPKERDIPTTIIHSLILDKPVDIIRVHNTEQISMLKQAYNLLS